VTLDGRTEGPFVAEFIERHCRLTRGDRAGQLVRLLPFQVDLLRDLFELKEDGRRRYRRAYVQLPRKNGKTSLLAAVALYEALLGEVGGEVYFVAGDRQQASRAFDECRRIVEQDRELASLVKPYRLHMEVPSTGTLMRVLSAEAGLQMGLSPSFVVFDEVAVQPTDRLWNTMSLGSGARAQPLLVGISTPGWERDSLAFRLYQHGRRVQSGEVQDPTFFFRCWEPADQECDYRQPAAWREANPALGAFLNEEDFQAALGTTPEMEFRRFRLGQWTSTQSAAFPYGAWEACAAPDRQISTGETIMVGFDGARERDCTCLIGVTLDERPHIFPIEVFEPAEGARVDPKNVAEAIRETCRRYDVQQIVCDEHLWSWVLLELESEGLPVLAMPQNAQRSVKCWQRFADAVLEGRLTHDGDLRLARHVANLILKSDRFGTRPTRDRTSPRSYIDAAMAAIWAYNQTLDQPPEPEALVAWV
jgi:phage terminase large subunit-like protein